MDIESLKMMVNAIPEEARVMTYCCTADQLAVLFSEHDRLNLVLADRQAKIAELMGEIERARLDAGDVRAAGTQMANVLYNLARGAAVSNGMRASFRKLQEKWDEVVRK